MWVSFLLAFGSMAGLWIVARNQRIGWAWCLAMEIPWTIYAFMVKQQGLAVLCIFYAIVYLSNLVKAVRGKQQVSEHVCKCDCNLREETERENVQS